MMGIGVGLVFMVFFWFVIIALAVWGVGAATKGSYKNPKSTTSQSPLEIAGARYARGEIDREQYEVIKKDLIQG